MNDNRAEMKRETYAKILLVDARLIGESNNSVILSEKLKLSA